MYSSFLLKLFYVIDRLIKDDLNIFEEQFMYGHREALLNYARTEQEILHHSSFLKAGLSHGWAPNFEVWKLRDRRLKKVPRYVWSVRPSIQESKDFAKYRQIPIGAPWLYLLKTLEINQGEIVELPVVDDRINLIVPFHSQGTEIKNFHTAVEHYRKLVNPRESTVCLFWLDYCDPINREIFGKAGFKVECVGYTHREQNSYKIGQPRTLFLTNLLRLFLQHRNYFTDSISTSFFYAATLGKQITIIDSESSEEFASRFSRFVKPIQLHEPRSGSEWLLGNNDFIQDGLIDSKIANAMAWRELGSDFLLSSKQMSELNWKQSTQIPNHVDRLAAELNSLKSDITKRSFN